MGRILGRIRASGSTGWGLRVVCRELHLDKGCSHRGNSSWVKCSFVCVSLCRVDIYAPRQRLHPPLQGRWGHSSHCRVRIYLPDDVHDAPVVICSELPNNPGGSISNSAEVIAAGVIRANELPTPLVWIEHWPKESTYNGAETLELVVFSSYEVTERAPYLGETRA